MSTITIDLNELRTLVARVIPFTSNDKYSLPVLESIYLQGKGDYLLATATDRYIVGISRVKLEGADGFDALVKVKDVRHILATFKSRKDIITSVTLTTSGSGQDNNLTVTLADGMFADADDLTARYSLVDGEFPKISKLFSEWVASTEVTGTGYNPAYLAKFAHVTGSLGEPIKISGGGSSKPTIVQAGDYFLGGIMPVRLTDMGFAELSDWVTTMEAKPAPKRRARTSKAKAA